MALQNLLNNPKVIKARCPSNKRYIWLSDGNGLMLRVDKQQNKLWTVRLYRDNKEYIRGIGSYPSISMAEAREIRNDYKKLWAKGIDPSIEKQKTQLEQYPSPISFPDDNTVIIKMNLKKCKVWLNNKESKEFIALKKVINAELTSVADWEILTGQERDCME